MARSPLYVERAGRADDVLGYSLAIYPLADPDGDRTYTLSWDKEEGVQQELIGLPGVRR